MKPEELLDKSLSYKMHPGDTDVHVINIFDKCKDQVLLTITWGKQYISSKKQDVKSFAGKTHILKKAFNLNVKR